MRKVPASGSKGFVPQTIRDSSLKVLGLLAVALLVMLSATAVFAAQIPVRTVGVCGSCDTESESPIVWKNTQIGYYFYTIASNAGLYYTKTVDHGLTWGTGVKIQTESDANNKISNFNVWYADWTPGLTSHVIHITWQDSDGTDQVSYRALNTTTDVLATEVSVSAVTAFSIDLSHNSAGITITQARGGNIYIASRRSNTPASGQNFWRSTDSGTSWTSRSKGPVSPVAKGPITPGNETDNQDIYAMDVQSTPVQIWAYDNSANTWAVIHTITPVNSIDQTSLCQCAFALDRSTPNSVFFAVRDNSVAPFAVYVREVVTAASVISGTTPYDTGTDRGGIAMFYDHFEDILYFISTQSIAGEDDPTFTFSEDRGATWEPEVYADTSQSVNYPRLAPTNLTGGGRFTPVFTITGADPVIEDQLNIAVITTPSTVTTDTLADKVSNAMDALGWGGDSGDLLFALLSFIALAILLFFVRSPVYVAVPIMVLWAGGLAIAGLLPPWIILAALLLGGVSIVLKLSGGTTDE